MNAQRTMDPVTPDPNSPPPGPEGSSRRLVSARRLALVAWTGGVLSILLLVIEYRLSVLHPASLLFLLLLGMAIVPALAALVLALSRRTRHPRWAIAAVAPLAVWAALGGYGYHAFSTRDIPRNLPMRLIEMAGASVMEARAAYLFPHRIETPRLIMFYRDSVPDPRRDAAEMDRHVARMEELTGLRLREKIFFVRGPVIADRHECFLGLAFGSAGGRVDAVDYHELAHGIMSQHARPDGDPPTMLAEGWAESQSVSSDELARRALQAKIFITSWYTLWQGMPEAQRKDLRKTLVDPEGTERLMRIAAGHGGEVPDWLEELTSDFWYHHDTGPVYPVGGAFADFVLRTYGTGKFVQLYFACRPGTFAADCQRILGTDLATLEERFWHDVERIARSQSAGGERNQPKRTSGISRRQ